MLCTISNFPVLFIVVRMLPKRIGKPEKNVLFGIRKQAAAVNCQC